LQASKDAVEVSPRAVNDVLRSSTRFV